jgi:hypothetical protein
MKCMFSAPAALLSLGITVFGAAVPSAVASSPVYIGSRRELFVDDFLIERMENVTLELHRPVEREIVLRFDRPWEGPVCGYFNVFQDGDKYRMYYRGWFPEGSPDKSNPVVLCYAESTDGITWTRPCLRLHEFQGKRDNNVVWREYGFDNVAVLKDTNPDVPKDQRYKALGSYPLQALVSPDGIHWRKLQAQPVITRGDFDSLNLAFYDPLRKEYRAYFRGFRNGVRDILTASSPDFIHWNDDRRQWIVRSDGLEEHLYTNATIPYFRAPHIYVSTPMRYMSNRPQKGAKDDGWSGVTDAVFMTSRDGLHFDRRFREAFIRPGLDQQRWITRNNCPAWSFVPTAVAEQSGLQEISVYWTEHYMTRSCRLRRGTLRLDGFASAHAGFSGGELLTKPLVFSGKTLSINYSTSAAGSVKVELLDAAGKPIAGRGAGSCPPIYGDEIDHTVNWKSTPDIGALAGKPVCLRLLLKDADVYAIQFRP